MTARSPCCRSSTRWPGATETAVPREQLVRVQTPQAFRLDAIRRAHAGWTGGEATDDAQVARAAGLDVVHGGRRSGARQADLRGRFRAGRGGAADDPRSASASTSTRWRPARSCGSAACRSRTIAASSAIATPTSSLHALTDAILGALAAGDIGDHFPPSDPRWRGAPSALFVEHARDLVDAGGRADQPCRRHHHLRGAQDRPVSGRDAGADRGLVAAAVSRVSIKATTTERLGFAGRGEGIAAQAVATLLVGDRR